MRGATLVLTIAAAFVAATLMTNPATGQTVTSVSPTVVGQSIARAVGRINLAGTPNSGKTITDGLAFTVDGTYYGRGTRTYEFDFNGVTNLPGAIAVTPSSNDVTVAFLYFAEIINADPTAPFWAMYYFSPPGRDEGIGNGWFMLVWKYDNEWMISAGVGLNLVEAADPGSDSSVANFSTTNPETSAIFLWLQGTGLATLTNASVKLRHDVFTSEVYSATLPSKFENTVTAKFGTLATKIGTATPPVFPSLGDYDLEINGTVVIDKAVKLVQNLLDDQTFRLHASASAGIYAAHNTWDYIFLSPYWRHTKPFPTPDGIKKAWIWRQIVPRVYPFQTDDLADSNDVGDNEHGSLQWSAADGVHRLWQSAYVNFTQDTTLTLTGLMAAGADQRAMTYGIQLRSGDENGTIIAETPPGQKLVTPFDWLDFSLSGVFPAGTTQVTVVFYADHPGTGAKALHLDTVLLRVDNDHPSPPSITGMTTANHATSGTSSVTVTLNGSNLTSGQTSVRLEDNIISFGCANWGDVGKFLTVPFENYEKARPFATYRWRSGDVVTLTGGTGVIPGQYSVVSRADDGTIELATDINGAAIDITNKTVTGWLTHPAISATSVNATGSQVTATFDLTGVPAGSRNIVVEVAGYPPVVWRDGLNIVLPGPSLTNGSFELPESTQSCDNRVETFIPANDWFVRHWNGYMDVTNVSPTLTYRDDRWIAGGYDLPSCPAPELGLHYGSTGSYSYRGTAQWAQTVNAEAGKVYTLSGFFGHSDLNKVRLTLLDGDSAAAPMTGASIEVLPAGSLADWTFAHVTGTATGDIMTAAWEVENYTTGSTSNAQPKVAWTDHLVLSECTGSVSVTSVSPYAVANDTVTPVTLTITGSGFGGSTVPEVFLVRTGQMLTATNITVLNDTTLTCEVTGFPTPDTAAFEVVVRGNGCIGSLAQGFVSAQKAILNEQFEEPFASLECGSTEPPAPRVPKYDRITSWNFTDELIREGNVWPPLECPLLSCDCPEPTTGCAGGHYASMSTGAGEVEQAWQTLKVSPGNKCTFGGWFSWDGPGTANIKLVDGYGPNGTVIATAPIAHNPAGNGQWCYSFVEGNALGHLVTVVWELVDTVDGAPAALHADFMTFAATQCHAPFADVDNDGDVDQADFAYFQACYTGADGGPIAPEPSYCSCLNVDGPEGTPDTDIDQADQILFDACASGPGVPADPTCNTQ